MSGIARGSGPRSGLYSEQRFTNWSPHDPYWAEIEMLAPGMRPRATIPRNGSVPLGIFDRPLAEGFVRPWSVEDVAKVLCSIPEKFLMDLTGVYLLGGTVRQIRLRNITYGMYSSCQIFLCAFPQRMLEQLLPSTPKPSEMQPFTKFGAVFKHTAKGATRLVFDESSIRKFMLFDVLLHEVGHHVDRDHVADDSERYARWFAEYQHARLGELS